VFVVLGFGFFHICYALKKLKACLVELFLEELVVLTPSVPSKKLRIYLVEL
jgi:hypothetical protein